MSMTRVFMKSTNPRDPQPSPEKTPKPVSIPPVEILQEARELLLKRVGPCAASSSDLVLVTAREIMAGLDSPPGSPATA